MRISVLTMFPEHFDSFSKTGLVRKAVNSGRLEWNILDIRDFTDGCFRKIDDSPYGGGPGLIIRCQPVVDALNSLKGERRPYSIALSPNGHVYRQADARRLSDIEDLALVCGHYEGLDARIYDHVDEILSIGDYILTGGELPAMVLTDSILRLRSGSLREESLDEESFDDNLLEYPQYTRPADFRGQKVPTVLLSGDHEAIRKWRREASQELTRTHRPDLFSSE